MVAAQVRGPRQRADKHGQMPREIADFVLAPDSTFTLHIISHSLSVLMQSRQVSLVTGTAGMSCKGTVATFRDSRWPYRRVRARHAGGRRSGRLSAGWLDPTRVPALIRVTTVPPAPRDL